ncbi:O-antigen ligase family protein, partial [Candidatus Omnitrophota bacterium]
MILLMVMLVFSRNPKAVRAKFETPLLIFLLIWIASYVHTLCYPTGVGLWRYQITVLFKRLITLVLAYFVFARCIKTKKELYFFFSVFLLSVVLVGLHTWQNGMLAGPHFADFKRSSGPFAEGWTGSDIAGGFLAIFTPFLLSFFLLTKKRISKILSLGGLGICIFGLLATYSRGSIVALVAALVFTILVSAKRLLKTSKGTAVIIFIIFTALLWKWQYWVPQSIVHRSEGTVVVQDEIYSDGDVSFDPSSEGRINK